MDDLFDNSEDLVLRDKRHFDVELVELAGRTVGAGVLVAKARSNLEITVEPGNHEQLLELLRRLGQGIKFSRMDARRHKIVACAFRRR